VIRKSLKDCRKRLGIYEMTILGLGKRIVKNINNLLRRSFKRITKPFRKVPGPETTVVPASWHRKPGAAAQKKSKVPPKKEKIVYRAQHHWPWLRTFKRGLAAILLLINFTISQFLIASQAQGAVLAVLFFGNVFIFIDYLWKTRRKEE